MANGITEPTMMTPSEIEGTVGERIGGGGGIGQDFQSWRYNVPQGELGTSYPKSRRKMRMEAEYQQYQLQELDRLKTLQQMEMAEKQYGLQLEQEQRLREKQQLDLDRQTEVQNQARMAMEAIRGTTLPDGQRTRPININDDDAVERLQSVIYSNPLGMESQATKESVTGMLDDALKVRDRNMQESQQQEKLAATLSASSGKPMEEFGEYTPEGIFKPNLNAIVAEQEAIKEKEAKKAEERTVATEKRRAETAADVAESRNIISQEREIDKAIRAENQRLIDFRGQKESKTRDKEILGSQNKILDLRIERAALRGLVFESEEEAEKANPPSGSTIYIGRKPFKVP